jgi:hypothetical protein
VIVGISSDRASHQIEVDRLLLSGAAIQSITILSRNWLKSQPKGVIRGDLFQRPVRGA